MVAAQATVQIDAEIGKKDPLQMETILENPFIERLGQQKADMDPGTGDDMLFP